MSNKPSLTNWDTALTNLIAVTGTHQTSGYASNEIILSSELNGLFNSFAKWNSFMNDVLGAAAVAAADINIGSGGGATGTITTSGTITSGGHVIISGSNMYKRGTRVRRIAGCAGILQNAPAAATGYYTQGWFRFRSSFPDTARWNLALEEGEQLQSVRAYVANGATDALTMKLFKSSSTNLVVGAVPTAESQVGSTQTSSNHTNLLEALSITGLTENITSGLGYYAVEVACTAFANNPTCYEIEYTTSII